ncbi:GNAT family N-acetyltransferase [Cryomorpha ignava]|uniref:GNAT family N-acetyltransferase n=1 Tax=Cryomorpha ignava TaxID=101383 RepID=A0A7K3WQ55_9FLAO|nr:GNAT family N-acetyltransferase [Cryomorpha ignava]NEN23686.1 GNAT family N-acetyltransferase [Cryomorpha ignava]
MRFNPFPEIKTKRLSLRKILESDCDEILFLRSDKTVNAYIERAENRKTKNISDAIKFIKNTAEYLETGRSIAWGITLNGDSEIIGTICLWNFSENNKIAEVGYDLNPKFQGKGIMSETLRKVIDFGFKELKLDKIEAFTNSENVRSTKLLENNGFRLNGDRKDIDNDSNIIFELDNTSSENG